MASDGSVYDGFRLGLRNGRDRRVPVRPVCGGGTNGKMIYIGMLGHGMETRCDTNIGILGHGIGILG